MSLIIIIFIAVNLFTSLINLLGGHSSSQLFCGLIGFVPNKKGRANPLYIKLISAYNAVRGTDSCGFYINGKVHKSLRDIRSYLADVKFEQFPNIRNRVILGHTRKGTYGKVSIDTAHPFEIEEGKSKLIFCHNGTISNVWSLAKKYGVEYTHGEVDSLLLGRIIQKTKSYDVLNDYEGSAALMFAYAEEPDVIYLFKGSSKAKWNSTELEEERPINFIKMPEGIYISSIREPLDAILNGDKSVTVYTIPSNEVVKIKDNIIQKVAKIDRSAINKTVVHTPVTHVNPQTALFPELNKRNIPAANKKGNRFLHHPKDLFKEVTTNYFIEGLHGGTFYLIGNRYCDFEKLPDSRKSSRVSSEIPENIENFYMDGEYHIRLYPNAMPEILKPGVFAGTFAGDTYVRTFFEGVMIIPSKVRMWEAKKMAAKLRGLKNVQEKIKQLSAYTEIPICAPYSYLKETKGTDVQYFYNGGTFKGTRTFTPEFSLRTYEYLEGDVWKIYTSSKGDPILSIPLVVFPPEKTEEEKVAKKEVIHPKITTFNPIIIIEKNGVEGSDIALYREKNSDLDMEELTCGTEDKDYFDKFETYILYVPGKEEGIQEEVELNGRKLQQEFVEFIFAYEQPKLNPEKSVSVFTNLVNDTLSIIKFSNISLKRVLETKHGLIGEDYLEDFISCKYWELAGEEPDDEEEGERGIDQSIGNEGFGNSSVPAAEDVEEFDNLEEYWARMGEILLEKR